MKSTGMVRALDDLGRIVLPIEMRRNLNIAERDSLEIFVDGNTIVLKKHETACIFCGSTKNLTTYKDKSLCTACLEELKTKED